MKRLFSLLIALSASLTLLNLGLVYADDPPDEISETEYAQNNGGFSKYHDFSADEEQFGFTHVVGGYSYTDSGDAEHGRAMNVTYNSTGFLYDKLKNPITEGSFMITFDVKPMTKGIYNFMQLVNADTGNSAQGIPASNMFLTFGMKEDGFNYFPGMDKRGYYELSTEPYEYEIGKWYNISIFGDFDKKTLYYYINDELYKTDRMKDAFNALYAVRLCSYSLGNGTMTYMLDNWGIMRGDYSNIKQWIDKGHQAPNHIKSPVKVSAADMPFGNNFYDSDINVTLNFENSAEYDAETTAFYSLVDEHGQVCWNKEESLNIPRGETASKKIKIDSNKTPYGLIKLKAELTDKNNGKQSFYEEDISNTRTAEKNMKIGIHTLLTNDRLKHLEYTRDIMQSLDKVGFGLERDSNNWIDFEQQKGVYQIEDTKKYEYEEKKDLKFDRMMILSGGNPIYLPVRGALPVTDAELKAWYDYCYNVTKQTMGLYKYYEVWNEPNLIPNFNPTGVDAKGYTKVLKAAREAILAANPDAIIVGIAQSNYGTTYISQVLEAGGGEYLDAISIHPYMWSQGPEAGQMEFVGKVRECIDSYGYKDIPLFVSEIGWQISVGLDEQAIYNTQMLILNEVYGYMDKIWFFRYTEAPTDVNEGFGFLNSVIAQKPFLARRHFGAVANFNRLMNEVTYKKTKVTADGVPLYEFTLKDGRSCIATWNSSDEKKDLALDLGCESVTVSDIYGNESTVSAANGIFTFSVDKFPMYIVGNFDKADVTSAQSSVGAKEINIVPGSKAELYVQTIESDDVSVFVDGTENLTVESVENVGGGRYKAVVAASGDYSGGEMIKSSVTQNGNLIYSAKTTVNKVDSVTVKTNVEYYASNRWRLVVDINNNLYENSVSGKINIQEPTEFANRISTRDVAPIKPGGESVTKIHIPDLAGTKDLSFKGNLVMSDGTEIDLSRVISFKGIPYMRNVPNFDGVISPGEWNTAWKLNIGKNGDGKYVKLTGDDYSGDDDLSGEVYLSWDKKNFYLAAEVKDETFETDPDGRLWAGDSIQFAFSLKKEASAKRTEIGIGIGKDGPEITRSSSLAPPSDGSRFIHELSVVNNPDTKKTVYELSIPWSEMFPSGFSIADYTQVLFSFLINDRDNNAREGYYEIGSGIGTAKDPSMHFEYNLMK